MDLSCNQIDTITFGDDQCPKLDYLNISYNLCMSAPNLQVFPLLTQFLASDNQIQELTPLTFLPLENLKVLDLSNNSIRVLPNELGLLPHLNYIGISGNLFRNPSQSTIKKGTSAVLLHLRQGIKN